MIPMTIPTLTNTWNRIIDARPAPNSVPNGSRERQAQARIRQISAMNSRNTTSAPRKPELLGQHGEHEVALLDRQEAAAGLGAVREPGAEQARPSPTVICDWSTCQPEPWVSVAGLRNERIRSFW